MEAAMNIFTSFDDAYPVIVHDTLIGGERSSPRGMGITECLGHRFRLTSGLRGTCLNANRKLNYAFAVIEKWEYVIGVSDPERICFYNSNMARFINDKTGRFDGAYGPRLMHQYPKVLRLFSSDRDTRQAVLNINEANDKRESKDVPCTIALQAFIRKDKLHMVATMRSNDLLWGTPYDVNGFTTIQEALASWLGVEVGEYVHQAGSLHVYDSTREQFNGLLKNSFIKADYERPVFDLSYKETQEALHFFFFLEKKLRSGDTAVSARTLPKCLASDFEVLRAHCIKKMQKKQ